MHQLQATIYNEAGIHCRPSALIIKALRDYAGAIEVINQHGRSDPRSMLGLMSLCLTQGTTVTIEVDGPDEEATALQLKGLFETIYDFPPQ